MDPVVKNLLKALQARIDGLRGWTTERVENRDVFKRGPDPFLQIEICRDHLALDLWLPESGLEEARSSGIARAHPFLGLDAIVVRFERAEDLARVARWIETSFDWTPRRAALPRPSQPPQALIPSLEGRLQKANAEAKAKAEIESHIKAIEDERPTEPAPPLTPLPVAKDDAPTPRAPIIPKKIPAPDAAPAKKPAATAAPKKPSAKATTKTATKKPAAKKKSTAKKSAAKKKTTAKKTPAKKKPAAKKKTATKKPVAKKKTAKKKSTSKPAATAKKKTAKKAPAKKK